MVALLAEDPEVNGVDVVEVDLVAVVEIADPERIVDHVKIVLLVEIDPRVKTVDQERTAHHVKTVVRGRIVPHVDLVRIADQEKIDPHASRRRVEIVSRHAVIVLHAESLVEKEEVDVADPEVLLLAG